MRTCTRVPQRRLVCVGILLKFTIQFGTAVSMMSHYNDYYKQCSFYSGPNHCPGYMYGYQHYYATQGRGPFGKPLRELPDQEQGGVDEPESIQFDDSEVI